MNRREFLKSIPAMIGSIYLALQDNPILSIPEKIKALGWFPLRGLQQDIDYYHFIIAEAEGVTGEIISRDAFQINPPITLEPLSYSDFDHDKTLELSRNIIALSFGIDVNDLR